MMICIYIRAIIILRLPEIPENNPPKEILFQFQFLNIEKPNCIRYMNKKL